MDISNDLSQPEGKEDPKCHLKPPQNDTTNPNQTGLDVLSDIQKFGSFMRFLAPPTPSQDEPGGADSISRGKKLFVETGFALCHTPSLRTGSSTVAAVSAKEVDLYSDLALHDMGDGLADGISQGQDRAIATRYDKLARNFLAAVQLVAAIILLN